MKKVYQTIISSVNGNCMEATVASILEKNIEDIPDLHMGSSFYEYMFKMGYTHRDTLYNRNFSRICHPTSDCFKEERFAEHLMLTKQNLSKYKGIDGYFFGTVFSPKFFTWGEFPDNCHAVVVNEHGNIVHDPNHNYNEILTYPLQSLLRWNGLLFVEIYEKI